MVTLHEIDGERGERRRSRVSKKSANGSKGTIVDAPDTSSSGDVSSSTSTDRMRKLLLGLGFWVQGLRCFPWLGVNFFLKDGLRVDPSTLQILQSSANLPMVAKPFYGILSDSYFIFGQHRIPYVAIGGNAHSPLF